MAANRLRRRGADIGAQHLDPGPVGRRAGALPSGAPKHEEASVAGSVHERTGQPALADPWFATHEHKVAATGRRLVEERRQFGELAIATDEPRPEVLDGHPLAPPGRGAYGLAVAC